MRFIDSCNGLLAPTPCDSKQVALYITWLSKFLKFTSIKNYLSALNHFLKSEDSIPIDYSSYYVKTVLGGTKRYLGCAVHRTAPLLPKELKLMFTHLSNRVGYSYDYSYCFSWITSEMSGHRLGLCLITKVIFLSFLGDAYNCQNVKIYGLSLGVKEKGCDS